MSPSPYNAILGKLLYLLGLSFLICETGFAINVFLSPPPTPPHHLSLILHAAVLDALSRLSKILPWVFSQRESCQKLGGLPPPQGMKIACCLEIKRGGGESLKLIMEITS